MCCLVLISKALSLNISVTHGPVDCVLTTRFARACCWRPSSWSITVLQPRSCLRPFFEVLGRWIWTCSMSLPSVRLNNYRVLPGRRHGEFVTQLCPRCGDYGKGFSHWRRPFLSALDYSAVSMLGSPCQLQFGRSLGLLSSLKFHTERHHRLPPSVLLFANK